MIKRNLFLQFIIAIGASALLAACAASSNNQFVASPNARRYEISGRVVSIDRRGRQVIIAHEAIPNFMDAMTMPFTFKDEWALDVMQPNHQIRAVLVVDGERSWIEQPTITGEAAEEARGNANTSSRTIEAQPGAAVPDFTLVNQDNRPVSLQQFRGQAVLITFIYTRCPLPDYCPLMTSKFAEINNQLSAAGNRVRLLSVTIDPEHDTAEVLRAYGLRQMNSHGSNPQNAFRRWEFATGTPQQIQQFAGFFGLSYERQNNQILHSLRTAVIAPDGRVFKIYRGSEWTPAQAINDLNEAISSSS